MSTQQDQPQTPGDETALFEIQEIKLTTPYIEEKLAEHEAKYGLTSETFYQLWLKGEGPDTVDTSGWAIMYEILQKRKSNDLE
jgi:hypothetical protein